jgi:hypothetical protein
MSARIKIRTTATHKIVTEEQLELQALITTTDAYELESL